MSCYHWGRQTYYCPKPPKAPDFISVTLGCSTPLLSLVAKKGTDGVSLASGLRPLGVPEGCRQQGQARGRKSCLVTASESDPALHRPWGQSLQKSQGDEKPQPGTGLASEPWGILQKVWEPRAAWLASDRYTQKVLLFSSRLGVG